MGVYSGPDVSESGLVFSLDAGNIKSFDNTENLLNNTSSTAAWASGSFTTETANRILGLHTVRITDLSTDGDAPNLSGTSISPGTYTVSHYIDTVNSTSTFVTLYIFTFHALNGGFTLSNANSIFALSTKTFSPIAYSGPAWSNASVSAVNIGNGIYRISITATTSLAGTAIRAYLSPSPADTSYLLVAGSQYESGSTPSNYYATTGTAKRRGTTIADLTGRGNTGTLTNGPSYNSLNGGSLEFDGTNDYVNIGVGKGINQFSGDFAVSVWAMRFSGGPLAGNVIGDYYTGAIQTANEWQIMFSSNGRINLYRVGSAYVFDAPSGYSVNQWVNIVVTRIGTMMYLYANNNLIATTSNSTTFGTATGNFNIGIDGDNSSEGFCGRISNVMIHKDKGLSAAEVQQNFNAARSRYGI